MTVIRENKRMNYKMFRNTANDKKKNENNKLCSKKTTKNTANKQFLKILRILLIILKERIQLP